MSPSRVAVLLIFASACSSDPASDTGETTQPHQPITCASAPFSGSGIEEGDMIADFTLPNCDKLPITISEQLGDKRLLLLEFGAGWCVACRDNQPHLKELVERFGDCIEVLTILSEEGVGMPPTSQFCAKWRDGCAERGCGVLPFQILTDPLKQTTKRHRDGSAIPVTVLTDRCGKVLFKAVGESPDLDDLVEAACSN